MDSPNAHPVLTEYSADNIHLRLVDSRPLDTATQLAIADKFNALNKERVKAGLTELHNGLLVRVHSIDTNNITCVVSSYAEWIASEDPEIFKAIQDSVDAEGEIEPIYRNIAVSGAILSADGVYMFGKRSSDCAQFPNAWELCPSGTVLPDDIFAETHSATAMDLSERLVLEMEEETGLKREEISDIIPLGLFQAGAEYEGNFVLKSTLTKDELQARFLDSTNPESARNDEYTELKFVKPEDLEEFAKANAHPNIVSTSAAMIPQLVALPR